MYCDTRIAIRAGRAEYSNRQRMPYCCATGSNSAGKRARVEVEALQVPLDAHQEQAMLLVLVLVGVQDIGIVLNRKLAMAATSPLRSAQSISRIPVGRFSRVISLD